jgi:3-keto-5-aminohexanoate cleavage enzyme
MSVSPEEIRRLMVEQGQKVYDAHLERTDNTMAKKLIINIAAPGGFIDRSHNPNLPFKTEEVAQNVLDAYNAGASIWHFHLRDPDTGSVYLPMEKRIDLHKTWCDSVFTRAHDIIINVGAIYAVPFKVLGGRLVDETSILAETRVAPFIEPLVKMGPNNRYVESAIILAHVAAMGRGTNIISFNNKPGIQSDVKYLQSKGIKVEISPFKHSDLADVKEWVIDTGIAKPPVILDTLMGIHNAPSTKMGMESYELLFTLVRMLPKGVLWQTIIGGRYWLPLTVAAISLGVDVVRIGMEDSVYMYPHTNDYIKGCGQVVEAVAGIAKRLGREVATPSEAREILGLPQIKK